MADGILGLGTGQASTLNQELIDKLKEAERSSTVAPIETDLEDWDIESEKMSEISSITKDFLETVKPFDLFITSGVNSFNSKSASTSGESVVFDAVDVANLNVGITTVNVSQLAQKDVYQSTVIADITSTISGTDNNDKLTINGTEYSTYGKSYEDLVEEINYNVDLNASLEQVGTDSYRLVIKSANTGIDNALEIVETGIDLGLSQYTSGADITQTDVPLAGLDLTINGTTFTTDGIEDYSEFIARIDSDASFDASIVDGKVLIRATDGSALDITNDDLALDMKNNNHTLSAQNLLATVDGISYDIASNTMTVDNGLKITAVDEGKSSINVEKDTTEVVTQVQTFITAYNAYVEILNNEIYSDESSVEDKSVLKDILSQVKSMMFGNYGSDNDLNLFSFGFELNKDGELSLDEAAFNTALTDDFQSLENLFIGSAESEGFGTQLKEYIDDLDGYNGLLTSYETDMDERKTKLEEELEKAEEDLDNKYSLLSQQFADYSAIITRFNSQFASLEMMIQQSVASN